MPSDLHLVLMKLQRFVHSHSFRDEMRVNGNTASRIPSFHGLTEKLNDPFKKFKEN
jgi:hypothetical protein